MSKNGTISFKIEGVSHLTTALASIKESVRNRYLRAGVAKATRIVRKAARSKISTGKSGWIPTGALKKSISVKIVNFGNGKIVGIVGPDYAHAVEVDGKPHNPGTLGHLIEYGHGGPSPAPPHPFMRPAWEESKSACLAAIRETLEAGLARELSK